MNDLMNVIYYKNIFELIKICYLFILIIRCDINCNIYIKMKLNLLFVIKK